ILVFVDFERKTESERPDFYILTVEDWKRLLEEKLVSTDKVKRGEVNITENNIPIWKDGWQGMAIRPQMISEHKERWGKIKEMVSEK
ncbi:unnamed protein product, partial [marine sediment metagenome]